MSSSRPATAARRGGGETTDHLWAKAAELERDFAGYKRRIAERRALSAAGEEAEEESHGGDADADAAGGRGRRYEEYVRKRDERLRHEWRARMERKEAEMQALWTRLDRSASRGGRHAGDDDGELAAASHAKEDHGDLRKKTGKLAEVKVKPPTVPATPRCGAPATTKLSRPRTSVSSSSPATASPSPRLSTPDTRRRPPPAEPPATPRKENRLPPSSSTAAMAPSPGPATPRPRTTMLSRSRSLFKDRGCSSIAAGRESPRPPRLQPPRSSFDSVSNIRELPPALPMHADATAVMTKSRSCSSGKAVVADVKKASAVAPEPFHPRRSGNVVELEPALRSPVIPRDEHDSSSEITPAGDGKNADSKSNQEHVEQSSNKFGSVVITGDSDTDPSYVYIKKDSDEQSPRPCQAPAGHQTCPGGEPRLSENEDIDNVDDTMESTGSNDVSGETPVTDTEQASRRESSESLYSNVQSSFSPRSELDTSATDSPLPSATEESPESMASPRPRKKPEAEDAEDSIPIPITPRSSITVQSPMDAVAGLKRLLTFGKKNGKGSEAAAYIVERTPCFMAPVTPAGDGCMSGDWPAGDSVKARLDSSDAASADGLDSSYVMSPHVRSLQSFVPPELKGSVLHAKSPRGIE
ncbi:hypothetical protein HU200_015570 [Digitaria exilis]|uniref:Uncharacterized protein n=1 Tax=Digitaria exilis TaxID=1010633 RepID=A0A835FAI5_9POAL|nr:hypothetical protein HU200_015570 [Digitaria exilis]